MALIVQTSAFRLLGLLCPSLFTIIIEWVWVVIDRASCTVYMHFICLLLEVVFQGHYDLAAIPIGGNHHTCSLKS